MFLFNDKSLNSIRRGLFGLCKVVSVASIAIKWQLSIKSRERHSIPSVKKYVRRVCTGG